MREQTLNNKIWAWLLRHDSLTNVKTLRQQILAWIPRLTCAGRDNMNEILIYNSKIFRIFNLFWNQLPGKRRCWVATELIQWCFIKLYGGNFRDNENKISAMGMNYQCLLFLNEIFIYNSKIFRILHLFGKKQCINIFATKSQVKGGVELLPNWYGSVLSNFLEVILYFSKAVWIFHGCLVFSCWRKY